MRAADDREVIHDLVSLGDPLENCIIGGVADFGISTGRHGRRRPGKRIDGVPFYAQLLDPVALESIRGVALAAEPDVPDIRFVHNRGAKDVRIPKRELQIVVILHLVKSRERSRKRRSYTYVERGIHGKASPQGISRTQLMVNARSGDIVVRKSLGSAEVISRRIGAIRNRIQLCQRGADRIDPALRDDVIGKRCLA